MANLTVILFLCATVPMIPAVYMLTDRRSRLFLIYLLLGMVVCLIASEVNSHLLDFYDGDMQYVSCNIAPFAEELLKAMPILYFAIFFTDDHDTLISIFFAMGLGFAVLENMVILTGSIEEVTVFWALVRGFGAARMHSACTSLIGQGICYINKRRKLFYCGTLSLLVSAVIAHALFNTLVQSQYSMAAYVVVFVMYIPHLVALTKKILSRFHKEQT